MFYKVLLLIVCATLIAATLVVIRQQRLEQAHAMTQMHRQIDRDRQKLWVLQADIADHLDPRRLEAAITRTRLPLDPLTPIDVPVDRPFYLVSQTLEGDGVGR